MNARLLVPLALCCSLSACSLLFSEGEGGPEASDAGAVLDADQSDAGTTELHIIRTIGTGSEFEFSTPQRWEAVRGGDLVNRKVFSSTPGMLVFARGESVTGAGGCSGKFVPEDDSGVQATTLTLDEVTGDCNVGTVVSNATGATATLGRLLLNGTIEIGVLADVSVYDEPLEISGSTTDANHYMSLGVESQYRHKGIAGNGPRFLPSIDGHGISVRDDFTRLAHMEVSDWSDNNPPGGYDGIHVEATKVIITAALIYEDGAMRGGGADSNGISLAKGNSELSVINSIVFDVGRSGIYIQDVSRAILNVSNCTLFECAAGSDNAGAGCVGAASSSGLDTGNVINVNNTIAIVSDTSPGNAEAFNIADGGADFGAATSHNISGDGSSQVFDDSIQSIAPGLRFVVPTGADLHILVNSAADGAGRNLDFSFTDDIDGENRTEPWDIGADQLSAP